jgi:hypothetical protein
MYPKWKHLSRKKYKEKNTRLDKFPGGRYTPNGFGHRMWFVISRQYPKQAEIVGGQE